MSKGEDDKQKCILSNIILETSWSLLWVILGSSWRKGQERSGKVRKGQERSGKVMEGHGRSYPNTRCVNNVRKVTGGGGGWWPVGL